MNVERAKAGCGALQYDQAATTAARGHSANMAAQNNMNHTLNGQDAAARLRAAGASFSGWGENIARGYRTPAITMNAWMNSPGHRANILDCGFTHIGIGVDYGANGPWWTQNFITAR